MISPHYWSKYADRLKSLGFEPVPIPPGRKGPSAKGWQRGEPEGGWKQRQWVGHKAHVDGCDGNGCACPWFTEWEGPLGHCGVGLLTRNTPSIDIDIRDETLAGEVAGWVREVVGDGPARVGQSPKILMPFRREGRKFKKLRLDWSIEGQDAKDGLEILSDGQQFVAAAIHPGTGKPYHWPSKLGPHAELPALSGDDALAFMRTAAKLLIAKGLEVASKGFDIVEQPVKRRTGAPSLGGGWTAEDVANAIGGKREGKTWRARCPVHCGVTDRSLSIKDGDDGRVLLHCHAGCDWQGVYREISLLLDFETYSCGDSDD